MDILYRNFVCRKIFHFRQEYYSNHGVHQKAANRLKIIKTVIENIKWIILLTFNWKNWMKCLKEMLLRKVILREALEQAREKMDWLRWRRCKKMEGTRCSWFSVNDMVKECSFWSRTKTANKIDARAVWKSRTADSQQYQI